MSSPNEADRPLACKVVCLGVTGGIAAYKAAELCSMLVKRGAEVHVLMTAAARRFVGELTFETLSHNPVITELFSRSAEYDPEHVALARRASAAVVAPATANILAKMACGIADDALSTALLTFDCPCFVAPAMNSRMWKHPATVENVRRLKERGVVFIGPAEGPLACRDEEGPGRMAEPAEIVERLEEFFRAGKRS
ncbi:MAG: phosphopantothenoylcysteine decarboxylase [Planctomycetota bacterium]|nr:MAG: phosphopantothenoylcysteine decarboxylase [Planctomycetota bacterium]